MQVPINTALFGLETEYAVTAFGRGGVVLDKTAYCLALLERAAAQYPVLFGASSTDLFLGNGARLYLDASRSLGLINIEYSTPECTTPAELVAHVRAGDRVLAGLARDLEAADPQLCRLFISKVCVDYAGHTWGSHENYLHEAPQAFIAPQMLAHLVSRIIYTGGGGFNDRAPHIEFMLSPRVRFLEHAVSCGSQSDRGIFSTKQENLSDTYYGRCHLLCSEGVRFQLCEYLRFGTTALLLKLMDLGLNLTAAIDIDPLYAINRVARDVTCTERIGRIRGKPATAIDIQRHLLRQVSAYVEQLELPPWAPDLCMRWGRVLDQLEADPMKLTGQLDWPTKLEIYRRRVQARGFDWEQVSRKPDPAWSDQRLELFEFDMRFGDISQSCIFQPLEQAASSTADAIVADRDIEAAKRSPPRTTRAKLRGNSIGELTSLRAKRRCDWGSIRGESSADLLLFDDPFASARCAG